jgi:hypothetical protein
MLITLSYLSRQAFAMGSFQLCEREQFMDAIGFDTFLPTRLGRGPLRVFDEED